jgi:hypothetical protein
MAIAAGGHAKSSKIHGLMAIWFMGPKVYPMQSLFQGAIKPEMEVSALAP